MSFEEMSVLTESNVNENESLGEDQSTISSVFISSTRPPPPNYYYYHPGSTGTTPNQHNYPQVFLTNAPPLEIYSNTRRVGFGLGSSSNDDEMKDGEGGEDDGGDDVEDDVTMEDDFLTTTTTTPPGTNATTATLTTTTTTLRPPPIPTTVDVPIDVSSVMPHYALPPPPPLPNSVPTTVNLPTSSLQTNHKSNNNSSSSGDNREVGERELEELEESRLEEDPSISLTTITAGNNTVGADQYYCQICFDSYDKNSTQGYELSICRHMFCYDCLGQFLKSKIEEGQVYPKCFYLSEIHSAPNDLSTPTIATTRVSRGSGSGGGIGRVASDINSPHPSPIRTTHSLPATDETKDQDSGAPYETINQQTIISHLCNEEISSIDIQILLKKDKTLLEKYHRFKFCRENKHARECPSCHAFQVGQPETTPKITCNNCQTIFCYYHSNAHNFEEYPTCEAYEASIAKETKMNIEFIQTFSKPCPHCGVMVQKTGGCNHMKCQCGVAFCWLCGKQIEDSLFPAHFQWWNPTGCSNLQMNEAMEPSLRARICARILSIIQIILLGPLTLASTLASTLLCFSCICLRIKHSSSTSSFFSVAACHEFQTIFSNCMSSWGIVWMILLVFLPLGIAAGGAAVGIGAATLIILYPCYAAIRISRREYPWPDWITDTASWLFVRFNRFYLFVRNTCFRRMFPCCFPLPSSINSAAPSSIASNNRPNSSSLSRESSISTAAARTSLQLNTIDIDIEADLPVNKQPPPKKKEKTVTILEDYDLMAAQLEEGNYYQNSLLKNSGRKKGDLIPDDNGGLLSLDEESGGGGGKSNTNEEEQKLVNRRTMITREEIEGINTLLTILHNKIEILEQMEAEKGNNSNSHNNQSDQLMDNEDAPNSSNQKELSVAETKKEIAATEQWVQEEIRKVVLQQQPSHHHPPPRPELLQEGVKDIESQQQGQQRK